ncbi:glutathione peroxidase [Cohnella lubricantis]|uniref:Glutathione peroxidase n=1 Tax=Cohnella lubricantis TaxID=2163172 RepID=A0A841TEM2_9BACL|nr:glutathione peroxidase [Cohnella lubricantis]MBB6677680.1 glutathione peroxidase [Cohnella lubricantis]MBP2117641.1 glutathione peroxidase [Cohnella lubricantis]
MSIYEIEVTDIRGNTTNLSAYRGKPMLIVNTATLCGFAPQFNGLQQLHERYAGEGLAVLGFPSNQFANQEPADNEEILQACELNHGVTFPLFAKIDVKGRDAHPLFKHLTKEAPGFLGTKRIKWNFTKFLIDRSGRVVRRFSPTVVPERIEPWIRKLL